MESKILDIPITSIVAPEEAIPADSYSFPPVFITLLLQEDPKIESLARLKEGQNYPFIKKIREDTKNHYSHPMNYVFGLYRQKQASQISDLVTALSSSRKVSRGGGISLFSHRLPDQPCPAW